jgi:hypothetical protein
LNGRQKVNSNSSRPLWSSKKYCRQAKDTNIQKRRQVVKNVLTAARQQLGDIVDRQMILLDRQEKGRQADRGQATGRQTTGRQATVRKATGRKATGRHATGRGATGRKVTGRQTAVS